MTFPALPAIDETGTITLRSKPVDFSSDWEISDHTPASISSRTQRQTAEGNASLPSSHSGAGSALTSTSMQLSVRSSSLSSSSSQASSKASSKASSQASSSLAASIRSSHTSSSALSSHASSMSGSLSFDPLECPEEVFFGRQKELQQLSSIRNRVIGEQSPNPTREQQNETEPRATEPSAALYSSTADQDDAINPSLSDSLSNLEQTLPPETSDADDSRPIYPAVLVWGTSGTGKSMLVDHFLNRTCCTCGVRADHHEQTQRSSDAGSAATRSLQHTEDGTQSGQRRSCSCCYILRGKYDEYNGSSDPFSAIAQALDDFATQLQTGEPEELDRIQELVQANFHTGTTTRTRSDSRGSRFNRSAISTLIAVVPSLALLLAPRLLQGGDDSVANVSTSSLMSANSATVQDLARLIKANGSANMNTTSSWNRLRYIFIQFMKAVSTPERPVYLFLDDLQWSSSAGLELLAMLISDPDLQNLMFIGAIRQETDVHNNLATELTPDAPLRTYLLDPLTQSDQFHGTTEKGLRKHGSHDISTRSINGTHHLAAEGKHLEQITAQNLSASEVAHWLSILFGRPSNDADLGLLSAKIHKKTRGNTYFTLQAIEELKRMGMLFYNEGLHRWEWDLKGYISEEADLPVSDNIVAVIESQFKALPLDLQHILSIAAYIRSAFDLRLLYAVLRYVDDAGGIELMSTQQKPHASSAQRKSHHPPPATSTWTMDRVSKVMELAVLENLITNAIGESVYHFAHDRVQQAAQGLVPAGETRHKLRKHIGLCLLGLYRRMNDNEGSLDEDGNEFSISTGTAITAVTSTGSGGGSEAGGRSQISSAYTQQYIERQKQSSSKPSVTPKLIKRSVGAAKESQRDGSGLLFIAADHLNHVPTKDHLFLVFLNVEVGERALELAALAPSAMYLKKASDALKKVRNPWQEQHEICLRLFRARSEVELSLGHFEIGYRLGHDLLQQAESLDEKLPTYLSMAVALGRQSRIAESLSLATSVARKLGEFPKRFYLFRIARDLYKIKAYMLSKTNDEIVNLPPQQDYQKAMAMQFIVEIGVRSFMGGDLTQWVLQMCRLVRMTMQYGICEESSNAFIILGTIWSTTNQAHDLVVRCADIALRLLERTQATRLAGWVYVMAAFNIYAFSKPLGEVINKFKQGYAVAMEAGEFEQGLINQLTHDSMIYCTGGNLFKLEKAMTKTNKQYRRYRIIALHGTARVLLQYVQWLTGSREIDWDVIQKSSEENLREDPPIPADVTMMAEAKLGESTISLYFGKNKMAYRLAQHFASLSKHNTAFVFISNRTHCLGISAAALYRQTKKRKYMRELKAQIKLLQAFISNRAENFKPLFRLLHAEYLSLKDMTPDHATIRRIQEAYDSAIALAIQSTMTNHCAMGCELAGEYLLRNLDAPSVAQNGDNNSKGQHTRDKMTEDARRYLTRAVAYYAEWGCMVKVKLLKERRSMYLLPNVLNPDGHDIDHPANTQREGLAGAGFDPRPACETQPQEIARLGPMDHRPIAFDGIKPPILSTGRITGNLDNDTVSMLTDG